MPSFYEFFAGGGMARAGLGEGWQCLFANDIDPVKGRAYCENWGDQDLRIDDVSNVTTTDLPEIADMAWASFPCQDLSLAGAGAGLMASRSGSFWPFWDLMRALASEGRGPKTIVLENVCGALSSHGGKDFASICSALSDSGYKFGAVVINAEHFLPQSRPRLFIIGVRSDVNIPAHLMLNAPSPLWHTKAVVRASGQLSEPTASGWVWWSLPSPPLRTQSLVDVIEDEPIGVKWHSPEQTERLIGMMTKVNVAKVEEAKNLGKRAVGGVYRRTREGVQRAEVRFDGISGCLRTPSGGSSRQTLMIVEGEHVRSRLLSPREAARLMGLPESYKLPEKYNDTYHLAGDGVAVPVVTFIREELLTPIIEAAEQQGASHESRRSFRAVCPSQ
jgi:DNA (cytosine-5)-methyltransferase 1